MKKTIALLAMTVLILSGCSGRSSDEPLTEEPNDSLVIAAAQAVVGQIRVLTSAPSLLTGTTDTATITAIVTDDSNRVIASQEVIFSSDGGVLQGINSETSEGGEASAQLNLAGDYRNRNITVTATLGSMQASVLVAATGTAIGMTAPENIIIGDTPELEFTLLAGNGQPIPNQLISVQSEAGNTFSQNTITTDANGLARLVTSTNAGADVITATAIDGTVVQDFAVNVVENIQAVDTPVRIRVISNFSSIETGGTDVASITTLVTDESNRVVSGKEVEFSATGGVLQNITSVTSAAGQATAELSLAGDFRNQSITVTARVDDEEGSVLLTTSGTSLSIAGPTALVSGNTAELELTLTGGNGQPISNEIVSIASSAGNELSSETITTDAAGKALVTVGSTAGSDLITVSALNSTVEEQHTINVAADILSVLDPQDHGSLSVDEGSSTFSVLWESNGLPVVGGQLKFSITAGNLRAVDPVDGSVSTGSVATTDVNGIATVEVNSNAAGPATIAFSDELNPDTFSQFDVEFVAVVPASLSVDASPASVATGNSSSISATVVDEFGNPVKDVVVEFGSDFLQGGNLSPVNAVTNSDGEARITFTAGSLATEVDQLVVNATVSGAAEVTSTVNLTVTERQLNVIIGLAGTVSEADSDTRYRRAGLVQVTDGAGRPVPDATILVSMIPTVYRHGTVQPIDLDGDSIADRWGFVDRFVYACESEDTNGNRILDTVVIEDLNKNGMLDFGEDLNGNGQLDFNEDINRNGVLDAGEDLNGNGQLDNDEDVNVNGVLDPSDPGLVDADPVNTPTVVGGQITTDANGVGFFSLAYPQSNAWWFDVAISARVQALGVEQVATFETDLEAILSDIDDVEVPPPNLISPYGEIDFGNLPLCSQPANELYTR